MKSNYNPFSLSGKTILVTGASSGIGRRIAIECASMGAYLIITGRNQDRLQDTFTEIGKPDTRIILADISNDEGLDLLISSLPKLDGVVLAAGIVEMWPVLFATHKRIDKIFRTNLFSPIELLRQIVKKKLYNPGLSIVAIDSIAGNEDFAPGNGIYGAGKAALLSFLKFFAKETAVKGIRVNTVSPGLILTPMHTQGDVSEEDLKKAIEKVPMKRWGQPEDIASAAVFLLSNASSYMTGSDIKIDGGYTL